MFVTAAVFGMIGLAVLEMVLSLFGSQIGLFGVSGLGMVTAFAGLILGVFMLIMDFDFVERGIAAGLQDRASWRAALVMTGSQVWIYTKLVRTLAIFHPAIPLDRPRRRHIPSRMREADRQR